MAKRRQNASIEGLGMSSSDSQVLGRDVQAGSIGADNIDSATGSFLNDLNLKIIRNITLKYSCAKSES